MTTFYQQSDQTTEMCPVRAVHDIAYSRDFELQDCEAIAIAGLVLGQQPKDDWERNLRFDIINSGYRHDKGVAVEQRHLSLRGLLREIRGLHHSSQE